MGNFVTGNTALPAPKVDASPPQGLATELDAADINNINSALGDLRTHGRGWLNVREYGATGDGTTDDTTALQNAINAAQTAGLRVYVPGGTFLVAGLTITASTGLYGEGTLKMKASTAADILTVTGTSIVLSIVGITFDGNEANQAFETPNRAINFLAAGTATVASVFDVRNCTFINGGYSEIRVHGDGTTATADLVRIVGNIFLGGREGASVTYTPRYIDLTSPTDYVVANNIFDRLSAPAAYGRAGVVAFDGFATTIEGRGVITGNTFVQVGRSQSTSSLGAIDLYSRARSVVVSGNSITSGYGRGINVKAESHAVAITGNTISGLAAGTDGTMSAQIVLNQSSTSTEANGPFTISGNSLIDSGWDGISVAATDVPGGAYAHGVLVSGNTITNAGRRGIGISTGSEISVIGNVIVGANIGIMVDVVTTALHFIGNQITSSVGNGINIASTNTTAFLDISANITVGGSRGIYIAAGAGGVISANMIKGPSLSGMDISGTTGPLRIANNMSDATTPFVNSGTNTALHLVANEWVMSTATHTLTLAAHVITATMDWHFVDTEAAASTDTMTSILGGYDGQVLTIRLANAAHVVTLIDGTNLRLNGDFTMDSIFDSITLRWENDAWIELARSDNVTTVNTASITAGGQAFSPSMKAGTEFIVASVTGAFTYTVNAPLGATSARPLTVRVKNTSAGAIGPATWNAIYKLSAWVEPAAGQSRSITFLWDGTNWVERSRTPADVPN